MMPLAAILLWPSLVAAADSAAATKAAAAANPVQKAIQLLTKLQGEVVTNGEEALAEYKVFAKWCKDESTAKQREIGDGQNQKDSLEATIEKAVNDIQECGEQIKELSGSIGTDGSDLKAAKLLRQKARSDFEKMDAELLESIRTVEKAINVLGQALEKAGGDGAAFLQRPSQGMQVFVETIHELLTAAGTISASSRERLEVLLQQQQRSVALLVDEASEEDDGDGDSTGAPSAAAYSTKSDSILKVLEDLKDEAVQNQRDMRRKEKTEQHNYELLTQSLETRIATQTTELESTKKEQEKARQTKADAEEDLQICLKDLEEDTKYLEKLQHDCIGRAADYEQQTKSRAEELKALNAAKRAMQSISRGGSSFAASAPASFLQVSSHAASARRLAQHQVGLVVLQEVKQLADTDRSPALVELASRVEAALHATEKSHATGDPFKKVKRLVKEMIVKLEKEQEAENDLQQFCSKELPATESSKSDTDSRIEDMTTQLEEDTAKVAELKQELVTLAADLEGLHNSQATLDTMRKEEHAIFVKDSAELQEAIAATRTAIQVLRDYYNQQDDGSEFLQVGAVMEASVSAAAQSAAGDASAGHQPSTGGAAAILSLLEVVEADFSKQLAEVQATEDAAVSQYKALTQEHAVEKAAKETTQKHQQRTVIGLDKSNAELSNERSEAQQELDAITEYWEKLKKRCGPKEETFQVRMERRANEIRGLKEALARLSIEVMRGES